MTSPAATRSIETIITSLDMRARPRLPEHHPPRGSALMHAHEIPLHFYRYLYHAVGHSYFWVARKKINDSDLTAIIHDERVAIYVLYAQGSPAGFIEIDYRKPGLADIAHLGLMGEHIGRGWGLFLACEAIMIAWTKPIRLLTIETCTLDHPRALALYQRCGFTVTGQRHSSVSVF